MDTLEKLQQAGLTGNESRVYLELVKKGELSANQIAKNLGMDRTLTYTVLNHLVEKGQTSYIIKENKNGALTLETIVCNYMEVIPMVLRWIPHIKVESPKTLQKEIADRIKKYLNK